MTTDYNHQANGWSASINAAEFYTCLDCGACIIETHGQTVARGLHTEWHERTP